MLFSHVLVRVVSRATTDVKGDDRHDRHEKTDEGVWKTLWFVKKSVTEFRVVGVVDRSVTELGAPRQILRPLNH